MLAWRCFPPVIRGRESLQIPSSISRSSIVGCAAKGPRPRYARVWRTNKRIGTISKSAKLVQSIKELSNVKEEVYGALDSFIAWELEFPLITVKKAIKTLEEQKDWKRIIQVIKWMLSKGQGRTMGSYFTLLNALAEDGRLEEAEELWAKLFSENLESTPRKFFDKMISIYYHRRMHDQMFEIFADMEELGVRPSVSVVSMVGKVFLELGMLDKYKKLKKKYPQPKWRYRYIKGRRIRVQVKDLAENDGVTDLGTGKDEEAEHDFQVQDLAENDGVADLGTGEDEEREHDSDEPLDEAESSSNGSGGESEEVDSESNDSFMGAEMSTDESQGRA